MSPNWIAPSLFAADFWNIEQAVHLCEKSGVDGIHYDIMDNHFVPNISFGPKIVSDIAARTQLKGDAHLMIDLHRGIDDYLSLPLEYITLHIESSTGDIRTLLRQIRQHGKKAGLSLKPKTPASVILPYLDELDLILVMTVEPGFSGQKFMKEMLPKIAEIRTMIKNRPIRLQVDGGVNRSNYEDVLNAGADFLVIGSAFFADSDPVSLVQAIHNKEQA
jgi:ribulose-phosphate 3-epimerase